MSSLKAYHTYSYKEKTYPKESGGLTVQDKKAKKHLEDKISEKFDVDFCEITFDPIGISTVNILRSVDVDKGSEVIIPVIAPLGIQKAIEIIGAVPRYADVTDANAVLDISCVKKLVNSKTAAIISRPNWGYPATTSQLAEFANQKKIPLLTDFTEAIGTRNGKKLEGTFGTMGFCYTSLNAMLRTDEQHCIVITNNAEAIQQFRDIDKKTSFVKPRKKLDNKPHKNYKQVLQDLENLDDYIEQLHKRFWTWNNLLAETREFMQPVWLGGAVKYNYQTVLFNLSEEVNTPAYKLIDLLDEKHILPNYKVNKIDLLDDDEHNTKYYPNAHYLKDKIFPLQVDIFQPGEGEEIKMKKTVKYLHQIFNG